MCKPYLVKVSDNKIVDIVSGYTWTQREDGTVMRHDSPLYFHKGAHSFWASLEELVWKPEEEENEQEPKDASRADEVKEDGAQVVWLREALNEAHKRGEAQYKQAEALKAERDGALKELASVRHAIKHL